ncbi:MAG: protein kinase [Acidobacteria bacterium]|nr:protein kinase [Acidobacteriota bacterium]
MTAEQWNQVKLLFQQIMDLEYLEAKNYIDENCKDEEIKKEVESLFMSHKEASNFLMEIDIQNSSQNSFQNNSQKGFQNQKNNLNRPSISSKPVNDKPLNPKKDKFVGTSRFLIQKRLGQGGFGVVYQVYDREQNSIVALKTLHDADAEDIYRFKKEFRSIADITHPNLATMYELFLEEDQWFFTMEMIYGVNFLEYVKPVVATVKESSSNAITSSLRKFPITGSAKVDALTEKAKNMPINLPKPPKSNMPNCKADLSKLRFALKQLAEGLNALHSANKLHRDLKPSNVLVTKEGRVVILDFGLVSELTAQGFNQITSDNIMGTPTYMSPEHIAGQAITSASDWYSVGIMLYLSLTGVLPFQGSPTEILLSKQQIEPLPPSELVSDVPEDLNILCQKLLKRNPRLRPTASQVLELLGHVESLSESFVNKKSSTPFIGREKELEKLNQAWLLTKQGIGTTIYIKGHSGMGKSTVLKYFLETLERSEPDLLIFSGRCYEQESVPYKAIDSIIDLLSRYLKNLPTLEVEALLPLDILALARLFPVLKQVDTIANLRRSLDSLDAQDLRRKAFNALRELLIRLTNKKDVAIIIDDLQWGDIDSVGLILEIIRTPEAPRLLLIGSYRSEESSSSIFLKAFFSSQKSIIKRAKVQEISVEELSKEDSGKLVATLLGKQATVKQSEMIIKESGGSPFFIGELAQYALTKKDLEETNFSEMTIDKVISARVALLSEEARNLLEIIAVSGQPLARSVAKRAAKIASDEQILPILRTNHLLRLTGTTTYEELDTYHDRIRESILANLSLDSLKNYHYALALSLETFENVDPERLAKHFQLAGERDKASEYTITAAEQADQTLAFERAAKLYRQSLELKTTQDMTTSSIKIKLGNALSNSGQGAEAARAYLEATGNSTKQGILKLQHKAAEQFLNSGYVDEGLDLLNQVLKKIGMQLHTNQFQTILSIIVGCIKVWLRGTNYQKRDEANISPETLIPLDICWTVVDSLSSINALKALEFQTKHMLLALEAGEPYRLVRALTFQSLFFSILGKWTKAYAAKMSSKALELAKEVNKPELLAMVTFIKGSNAYLHGDWKEAWRLFNIAEKITLKECRGENYAFALRGIDNSIVFSLRALLYLGGINEIMSRLPALLKNAEDRNNLFVLTNLKSFISYMQYLVMDEPERAYQELDETNDLWAKKGFYTQQYWRIIAQGEIGLYLGKGLDTWEKIQEKWATLKQSMLLNNSNILIEALHLQSRVALIASKEVSNPKTFLKIAKKNAKRILQQKTLYGDAWAELILAGVASREGDSQNSINYLTLAEKKFEKANMSLYLAATRRRRAEILEKLKGRSVETNLLITESDNWMYSHQIKNPISITEMLVPAI